jgi:LPS export ABC transporter protein LptC
MMFRLRILHPVVVVLVAVTIGVSFLLTGLGSGCMSRPSREFAEADSGAEFPEQEIWNSTITLSRNGVVTSKIQSGHIARYKARSETILDSGVVVDFYDREGNHTSVLTSQRGLVKDEQNDLFAWGNVVVVSDSGQVLRTEAIQWDNAREKIISDTFVTITTALDTLYGFGLVSDGELKNWEIAKPTGKTVRDLAVERRRDRQAEPSAAPRDTPAPNKP